MHDFLTSLDVDDGLSFGTTRLTLLISIDRVTTKDTTRLITRLSRCSIRSAYIQAISMLDSC